jgi:3-hydroxyacyl-[acyl-carrier-protein] dehydratase
MNRDDIKKIIPHREPMLLVDEAFVIDENSSIGSYTVRGDEFFLQGHFPGNPVVPGVILCEMLAQSCCVMLADKVKNTTPYFTSLNNVKFKNQVKPGDILEMKCSITKVRAPFYFAAGEGFVNGISSVVAEFSFALVPDGKE